MSQDFKPSGKALGWFLSFKLAYHLSARAEIFSSQWCESIVLLLFFLSILSIPFRPLSASKNLNIVKKHYEISNPSRQKIINLYNDFQNYFLGPLLVFTGFFSVFLCLCTRSVCHFSFLPAPRFSGNQVT